jgi:hypothetical protein
MRLMIPDVKNYSTATTGEPIKDETGTPSVSSLIREGKEEPSASSAANTRGVSIAKTGWLAS